MFTGVWPVGRGRRGDGRVARPARRSPFWPRRLKGRAGIIDREPRRTLAGDRALLGALLASAGEVVVSHCREDENGGPLSPCSLLNDIELAPLDGIDGTESAYRIDADPPLPASDNVGGQEREIGG